MHAGRKDHASQTTRRKGSPRAAFVFNTKLTK
jgi:hypothetical protein